jgi:hypothetical protein
MLRDAISKLGIEAATLPSWCHVSERAGLGSTERCTSAEVKIEGG